MIPFLAFAALIVGAVLFLTSANSIFRHDNGSDGVMVRCASGFVLLVAAATIGVTAL